MLNIDSTENGIVIDHITRRPEHGDLRASGAGQAGLLRGHHQKRPQQQVRARRTSSRSRAIIDIDLDVLGFIDDRATVCVIRGGQLVEKKQPSLPERLVNIVSCKNPRCITSVEQVDQVFTLCDRDAHRYRCIYCEQEYRSDT